jgi:hypothetical protein
MQLVSPITPLNLHTEREKFFQDFSYNPQFEYSQTFTQEELMENGLPQESYFDHVQKLLSEHGFSSSPPTIRTSEEVLARVTQLLKDLQLSVELNIFFTADLIPRCSITSSKMVFRLPIEFTEEDFNGLMNHEIQSHLLRRLNDKKQPWYGEVKDKKTILKTEEGIANLHSFVESSDKLMRRSWLNYCAIFLAQTHSFSQLFKILIEMGVDPNRAWYATVRTKRGLNDTGQKGGNTRGLVYLEGSVKVWRWIKEKENDPHDLYLGRIHLNELGDKKAVAHIEGLLYPTFFKDIEQYKDIISELGQKNGFDLLKE